MILFKKIKETVTYLKTQTDFTEREQQSDELRIEGRKTLSDAALLTRNVTESLLNDLQNVIYDSSRKIKYVGDLLPDALITTNISGHIETFSFGAVKLFGWTPREVIGKEICSLCPEKCKIEGCPASSSTPFETTGVRKTGEKFPIEVTSTEMELSDGSIHCLYLMRDITIRKQNEAEILKYKNNLEQLVKNRTQQLNEHKEMYKTLSRVSPVGIFRTDVNGECTYVNKRWEEISGMTAKEALGEGWIKAIHPDDVDEVVSIWHETHINKIPHTEMQFRFLQKDGTVTHVLGQGNIVNGGNSGFVGCVTKLDRSDRRVANVTVLNDRRKGHHRRHKYRP